MSARLEAVRADITTLAVGPAWHDGTRAYRAALARLV
jgi:hypothetical protein